MSISQFAFQAPPGPIPTFDTFVSAGLPDQAVMEAGQPPRRVAVAGNLHLNDIIYSARTVAPARRSRPRSLSGRGRAPWSRMRPPGRGRSRRFPLVSGNGDPDSEACKVPGITSLNTFEAFLLREFLKVDGLHVARQCQHE